MFSYLRPHRRTTSSSPNSPVPEQPPSFEGPLHLNHEAQQQQPPRSRDGHASNIKSRPPQSNAEPPLLPPIARVTSPGSDLANEYTAEDGQRQNYTASAAKSSRDAASAGVAPPLSTAHRGSDGRDVSSSQDKSQKKRSGRPYPDPLAQSESRGSRSNPSSTAHSDSSSSFSRTAIGTRLPTPPPAPEPSTSRYDAVPQRSSKTRLNLLNPMSLLARRRTSQAPQLAPLSLGPNGNSTPAYDPRIRGTKVHDFSAPRPRPVAQDLGQGKLDANNGQGESALRRNSHTPVFKEDFEEEQYPAAGPHVRKASDLADLTAPQPPFAGGTQKQGDQLELQKKEALVNNTTQNGSVAISHESAIAIPESIPESPSAPRDSSESRTPPRASASKRSTRPRNLSEVSSKDLAMMGLPKHMKSTSSRFSFDMIGAAKQEKLLEERHRQRALEKAAEAPEFDEGDAFDDFDYDPSADGYDYEEAIPGVNVDDEDDGFGGYDLNDGLQDETLDDEEDDDDDDEPQPVQASAGFNFYQHPQSMLNAPLSPPPLKTPRDANGEVIGFALSENPPTFDKHQEAELESQLSQEFPTDEEQRAVNEPKYPVGKSEGVEASRNLQNEAPPTEVPLHHADDELYFDDGLIEPPDDDGEAPFDESVFDREDTDQYGRPLKPYSLSISQQQTLYTPPSIAVDTTSPMTAIGEHAVLPLDDAISTSSDVELDSQRQAQPSQGLTFDSLAAYQSALAVAAQNAAASGKFRRDSSPSMQEDADEDHPNLVPDSGHPSSDFSRLEPFSPTYPVEDDFDYEDAFDDDLIIAEANAEALANDWDGFYGSEFGFYAAPAGSADTNYSHGGYFDPRGIDRMARSHSGRQVHRESNLTPITERSEYSNRNSVMSLPLHGQNGAMNSPGLSQLAGMLNDEGEGSIAGDMSLSALMKLRRGAWGGSQASLHSSNGSPLDETNSSPIARAPSWGYGHVRKNSSLSMHSDPADLQSVRPESPLLSMAARAMNRSQQSQNVAMNLPATSYPRSSFSPEPTILVSEKLEHMIITEAPDLESKALEAPPKHKRTSSNDSVSYLKESDPTGKPRWVIERRRTSDGGDTEVLEREIITGGQI